MAAIFTLPRSTLLDPDGNPIPGGTVSFYDANTTTPRAVYSNAALSSAILQPVEADSAGRLPKIYMTTGSFKIVVKDADGATIYTEDDLDSLLPAGTGAAVAALPDFFAADTEAEARTAIGAASQADLDALGDLAALDSVAVANLAAGFGSVILQRALVASIATVVDCTGSAIPYDNSIPQIGEGTSILSGSFTPVSASSLLEIELLMFGAMSAAGQAGYALYKDSVSNAIAAGWDRFDAAAMQRISLKHYMASPGAGAFTLSARGGPSTGHLYINGDSGGTRVGGGILLAGLRVTEYLVI